MISLAITQASPQIVAIRGELDTISAGDAQAQFDALGVDLSRDLTFDLSELSYISSSGLRFLLGVQRRASAKVAVVGLTEIVANVFHITGFDSIFCK